MYFKPHDLEGQLYNGAATKTAMLKFLGVTEKTCDVLTGAFCSKEECRCVLLGMVCVCFFFVCVSVEFLSVFCFFVFFLGQVGLSIDVPLFDGLTMP